MERKGRGVGLSVGGGGDLGKDYGSEALRILRLVESDATLGQLLISDLPYIRAEVPHACREEMALTPYDVLARRTSITLEDYQRGLGIVEEVAALMAQEQG